MNWDKTIDKGLSGALIGAVAGILIGAGAYIADFGPSDRYLPQLKDKITRLEETSSDVKEYLSLKKEYQTNRAEERTNYLALGVGLGALLGGGIGAASSSRNFKKTP